MVKFGDYVFPRVLSIQRLQQRQQQQVPLPGKQISYLRDRGGLGAKFSMGGEIRPASQATKDQISALADGTPRIVDFQEATLAHLESCQRLQTGPSWSDNTTESQSAGGTPFTLLSASSDYAYFGHREKFNQLLFDLQTIGTYGARTWEYSDGSGGWKTLTIDSDGPAGFTQDGAVLFTPPSDWKQDTVNSIADKFWIRVKAASVTGAATVNQIQINTVYYCTMADPQFGETADAYDAITYAVTFLQQENP